MKIAIKRVIAIVCILLIVVFAIIVLGMIARPSGADYDVLSQFYAEERDSFDVVFIGSSAMYRYWIPLQGYEEGGFTSYILGHGAQDVAVAPYLMEDSLKSQNPVLFVVETRQLLRNRSSHIKGTFDQERDTAGFARVASGMRMSSARVKMVHDLLVVDEDNSELEWQIPLLKYHDNFFTIPVRKLLSRFLVNKHEYKSARQIARIKSLKNDEWEQNPEYVITDEDKKVIDGIVNKADELNVDVLFVSTPYEYNEYTYSLQLDMDDYMTEKGYPYLNLCDKEAEVGLDRRVDYYNPRHTNISGARKVTSYLVKFLNEHYTFEKEKPEKVVKDWDECLKNWKQKESELMAEWQENVKEVNKKK